MKKVLLSGLAFATFALAAAPALAMRPTPGQCYSPCAQAYSDATDRIICIGNCCGCA